MSNHFDGKRFTNIDGLVSDKSFFDLLKWVLFEKKTEWPERVENKSNPDLARISKGAIQESEALVTLIGHASFLIQIRNLNILTDPLYSRRASPFSFAGPERVREVGLKFEDLPRIDIVLVSHNHYDHMDMDTLEKLQEKFQPRFILPLKNKKLLKSLGASAKIFELDWWEHQKLGESVKIHLAPAQHWSARGFGDRRESLWGAFQIEFYNRRIYFAGDTGLGPHFTMTKEKLGSPDIALLPIGAYEPRWFMKESHMNPDDAVQAHLALGAKTSIAMHFGTFQLTNEGIDQPVRDLLAAKEKYKVPNFEVMEVGETREFHLTTNN